MPQTSYASKPVLRVSSFKYLCVVVHVYFNNAQSTNIHIYLFADDTDGSTTTSCIKPTIDSAIISPSSDSITAGQSYSVACTEDYYSLYGSDTIECNDDGTLSMAPTCIC